MAKKKELKREVKAAPDGMPDAAPADTAPPVDDGIAVAEEEKPEVYSAQVLRRMHQDGSVLLQDYDEMLELTEHPEIRQHLQEKLEHLATSLDEIEDLFTQHHPDLPPIEGAMGDKDLEDDAPAEETEEDEAEDEDEDMNTMDDAGVAADSGENEEPTPDEVVEGMDTKALRRRVKVLEARCRALRNKKGKHLAKSVCAACKEKGKTECSCGGKQLKKDLTEDEAADIQGEVDAVGDQLAEETADTEPEEKALDDKERTGVGEAADFLGEVGAEDSAFGDDERNKSYHYHKTLEGIAGLQEIMEDKGTGGEVGAAVGSTVGGAVGRVAGEYVTRGKGVKVAPLVAAAIPAVASAAGTMIGNAMSGDKAMGCRKSIGEASGWLGRLAKTYDFGMAHRDKSNHYHKVLKDLISGGEEAPKEDEEDNQIEPGEMGEKHLDATLAEQDLALQQLEKQMQTLHAVLTNGVR